MKRDSRKHYSIPLISLVALILSACSTTNAPGESPKLDSIGQIVPVDSGGQYTDILPSELKAMMDTKEFFFINVHIPYEGELPETDAFIPFDEIVDNLDELPPGQDAKVMVYCRSGSMSTSAARELVKSGYTNVYNLDGGFRAWSQAGYEFIQ
jgi:rhodanese-related sulfurtransferase